MTSARDNDELTRVGPGTVMGELMRQYWIPACLSSELEPGGDPMRLLLLGEQLIAFRDGDGRVGIMDHRCPHRCASLFFARAEGDGLRCVYHGWKFDADGKCLDMPNLPPEQDFKHRIHAKAYKTAERGGLIWTYMGPRAEAPPLPNIDSLALPEDERITRCHQRECNWLQALEGDIDTSHFSFLHLGTLEADEVPADSMHRFNLIDRAPRYHVVDADWGTMYTAYRPAEPGQVYYRFSQFIFPFITLPPDGTFTDHIQAGIWVPMDDTHTMVFTFFWTKRTESLRRLKDGSPIPGSVSPMAFLPRGTGWYDRWRLSAHAGNDYLIDRAVQRDGTYSGLQGLVAQDQAVTESMGAMVDRSLEHLAPSDRMITMTRRRLLNAARALRDQGTVPPGVDNPEVFRGARAGAFIVPEGKDWREAYDEHLGRSIGPRLEAAE
ncbi:MAG TPA: Rieske 2Fe-2S domain-containing protein [Reyranella sp.]|nr:Rieske 2Fe-2S domain-containing protein [Reyranella sp.]